MEKITHHFEASSSPSRKVSIDEKLALFLSRDTSLGLDEYAKLEIKITFIELELKKLHGEQDALRAQMDKLGHNNPDEHTLLDQMTHRDEEIDHLQHELSATMDELKFVQKDPNGTRQQELDAILAKIKTEFHPPRDPSLN